jgi:hypothetical protein
MRTFLFLDIHYALCIYLSILSFLSSSSPNPLHLPKHFFFSHFGHSSPFAFTQVPFLFSSRSLQTICIYPMYPFFSPLGHSSPSAFTQVPFLFSFRSLQTLCIYPNTLSFLFSVTPDPLHLPKHHYFSHLGHSRSTRHLNEKNQLI